MHEVSIIIEGNEDIPERIAEFADRVRNERQINDKSVLFQIFSSVINRDDALSTAAKIKNIMPDASVIGTSSSGEIADGSKCNKTTVVSVLMFSDSTVKTCIYDCSLMSERESGRDLADRLSDMPDAAGIEVLNTASRMKTEEFFDEADKQAGEITVFGGGAAGKTIFSEDSFVFSDGTSVGTGAVIAIFCGKDLHIEAASYSGWTPIGKEMKITEATDRCIRSIDGIPAMAIYEKYLNIHDDDMFGSLAMEFPFFIKRNDTYLPRIPGDTDGSGGLRFIADVEENDKIRLAYGDPGKIVAGSVSTVPVKMREFAPEYIFIVACDSRQVFLKNYAETELKPFEDICPNSGFYSHGEIISSGGTTTINNAILLAVGMREGDIKNTSDARGMQYEENKVPTISGDPQLVARLTNFLEVMAKE